MRGKTRLARILLSGMMKRRDVTIQGYADAQFVVPPSLREPVAFHTLIDGIYEPEVVALLERFLPVGGTFLDVGANIGVFSVIASRMVGSDGTVVSIEAAPRIHGYLARNIRLNACANVRLVEQAATDKGPQIVSFWPAPDDHFGMGALAPQFSSQGITVSADTIDHVLASLGVVHVDLVKVDVEGFEHKALSGAFSLLTGERPPRLIFEFADWAESRANAKPGDAQRFLQSLGYTLYSIGAAGELQPLKGAINAGSGNFFATRTPA